MGKFSSNINILVMPTDICNMHCVYCFHNVYHKPEGRMSIQTLNRLYQIAFETYSNVTFIWHGGEPLVMGLDFYKEAIYLQEQYHSIKVKNRMQSNLTLMTDEIADFLIKNHIGVGGSFDGLQNDALRGNTDAILAGREKLITKGGHCGFIYVVSKQNIDFLMENYEFFKKIKSNYTMNLYVPSATENNYLLELEPSYAARKILEFYEYWLHDTKCNIQIDYFERFLRFFLWGEKNVCKYNSCLGKWVGVRYDGELVPCNRFFPKEYSYGNVWDYPSIDYAFESDGFRLLLSQAIERRNKCKKCFAYPLCTGGCNNVAYNENGVQNSGGNSCVILRHVFEHISNSIVSFRNDRKGSYNPMAMAILKPPKNRHLKLSHHDVHCDGQ